MAVVRARSSPPYGLFAAVAFAVIATGAAVILYVMWSKSLADKDAAVSDKAQVVKTNDKLNEQITGLNNELSKIRGTIASLTLERDSSKADAARQAAQVDSANKLAQAREKALGAAQGDFGDLTTRLQNNITEAQSQLTKSLDKANLDAKAAETKLNDAIQKADDEKRGLVLKLEDAQGLIARQEVEIRELRIRIRNEHGGDIATTVGEPAGRVIRVNGVTGEVWINLGKKDRIMAGMPFSVYDPRLGVRWTTDDTALGNGSLEVMVVGEEYSICRITRTTKDRAIQDNDLIANLVYQNDRTRKFRFVVFGDFDLDGDGVSTAAERDRLITLIQAWGGQVDDDVTAQTDFLVLGALPAAPLTPVAETAPAPDTAPAAGAAPTVAGSIVDARLKDQVRYESLRIAAKGLAIPVLNQNRFLAMVGYYNTTVVRY